MNEMRLLKLANFLIDKVPDEHFDLDVITRGTPGNEPHKRLPKVAAGKSFGCGTVGCAIGWCPVAFPKDFKYSRKYDHSCYDNTRYGNVALRKQPRVTNFEAAEVFFCLTEDEAGYLFSPGDDYSTRKDVAKRIRKFVKAGGLPK